MVKVENKIQVHKLFLAGLIFAGSSHATKANSDVYFFPSFLKVSVWNHGEYKEAQKFNGDFLKCVTEKVKKVGGLNPDAQVISSGNYPFANYGFTFAEGHQPFNKKRYQTQKSIHLGFEDLSYVELSSTASLGWRRTQVGIVEFGHNYVQRLWDDEANSFYEANPLMMEREGVFTESISDTASFYLASKDEDTGITYAKPFVIDIHDCKSKLQKKPTQSLPDMGSLFEVYYNKGNNSLYCEFYADKIVKRTNGPVQETIEFVMPLAMKEKVIMLIKKLNDSDVIAPQSIGHGWDFLNRLLNVRNPETGQLTPLRSFGLNEEVEAADVTTADALAEVIDELALDHCR